MHIPVVDYVTVAQHGTDGVATNERQDDRERERSVLGPGCRFSDQFGSVMDQIDLRVITEIECFIFIVIAVKVEGVNAADGSREDSSGGVQSVTDIQSNVIIIDWATRLTKRRCAKCVEKDATAFV